MSYPAASHRIGYAYDDGLVDLQAALELLRAARCNDVFVDDTRASRSPGSRPQLQRALAQLQEGDVLIVPALETIAAALPDLVRFCGALATAGVRLASLEDGVAEEGAFLPAMETLQSMQRRVARNRATALRRRKRPGSGAERSPAAPREVSRGVGRKPAMSPGQIAQAQALLAQDGATVTAVAKELGVSRTTLYKHVPMLAGEGSVA